MSYLGSKRASGAREAIIGAMPPHETYIEAFAGSGAVLKAKPRCQRSIVVDRDAEVFRRFTWPRGVERVTGDAIAYLDAFDYERSGKTLVYCDPPYVLSTRTSRKRYRFEMTDDDHARLIAVLRRLPCSIIISGYVSSLYLNLLHDWRRHEFQVMTRGGVRTECIWMNYSPGPLVLSRFVGRDSTDRQRIKRKAERWAGKFRLLPAPERTAVMAALLAVPRG